MRLSVVFTAIFIGCALPWRHGFKHPDVKTSRLSVSTSISSEESIHRGVLEKGSLSIEVLSSSSSSSGKSSSSPPIIFVHGSFHSAWCFTENYHKYFNDIGHDCYAISLRGTKGTGLPLDQVKSEVKSVGIEEHVSDVSFCIDEIIELNRKKTQTSALPIVVAHSFGGLILMKLLETVDVRSKLSGVALMCSVPPSGNGPMTGRFIKKNFLQSLKIVYGFVLKAATKNVEICRELFFDESVSDVDIDRYMQYFRADSVIGIDLTSVAKFLPSKFMDQESKQAAWVAEMLRTEKEKASSSAAASPSPSPSLSLAGSDPSSRVLVMGAEEDYIVDYEGNLETAVYFGQVKPVMIAGGYHDLFLGPRWKESAVCIADWLKTL